MQFVYDRQVLHPFIEPLQSIHDFKSSESVNPLIHPVQI